MSGLAAIIHFDGREVEPGAIDLLAAEMAYRGPDGITFERQQHAALAFCALHTTAESLATSQPLKSDDGSLVMIFDGHLHNLAALRDDLAAKGAILRIGSDGEVALRAYELWREDSPLRMEGEFAFVVWDSARKTAFCARDHAGLKPLHYHWDGSRLVVASDPGAILAVPGVEKERDDLMVDQILANEWITRDRTIWKGIRRFKPATWTRFDPSGVREKIYWHPPLEVSIRYRNDDDYVDHYRELLAETIRQSSRSHLPIASDVSGGLDSSAIFAIAKQLERAGRLLASEVRGYTYKTQPGTCMYEMDYARAVATHVRAPIHEIQGFAPDLGWFVGRARDDRDVAPYPSAAMTIGIGEALVGDGCRVSLNGEGGDEFLAGRAYYYAEQLSDLDWPLLARTLREDAADIGVHETAYRFTRYGMLTFLPQGVRDVMRRLFIARGAGGKDGAYWLTPEKRALLERCRGSLDRSLLLSIGKPAQRIMMTILQDPYGELLRGQMDRQSARSGYERRTPMFSRRFIEFAFSTPERLRMKGSREKRIHVAAMAGLLPDKVLERRDKAEFSPAFTPYLDKMRTALVTTIPPKSLGFLSSSGMARLFEQYRIVAKEKPIWELWAAFACFTPLIFDNEAQTLESDV